ncbi:MAG: PaaI family thioesterase [Enterococcus sp.]
MAENKFIEHNGIIIETLENNEVRVSVELQETGENFYGMMHGGLIFSLADTTAGVFTRSLGINSVTLSANINYLKPITAGKAYGVPTLEHRGRTTVVVRVSVFNERHEQAAVGLFTMFITS